MLFDGFAQEFPADGALCARYQALLPKELTDVWRQYGFGTLLNGYLKIIPPQRYQDLLRETCVLGDSAIPIFATALADLIVWDRGRYLRIVQYPRGVIRGISAGFGFFWADLAEGACDRFFDLSLYQAAAARLGVPKFDECFGQVPLPVLGGSLRAERLRRCSLQTHIELIAQAGGTVGF